MQWINCELSNNTQIQSCGSECNFIGCPYFYLAEAAVSWPYVLTDWVEICHLGRCWSMGQKQAQQSDGHSSRNNQLILLPSAHHIPHPPLFSSCLTSSLINSPNICQMTINSLWYLYISWNQYQVLLSSSCPKNQWELIISWCLSFWRLWSKAFRSITAD